MRRVPTLTTDSTDPGAQAATVAASGSSRIVGIDGLRALAVMASVSPLLGLLGTVGGMIDVFDRYVSVENAADKVRVFSSGISVALVTTFAGLSVAIPATILHQFFLSRVTRFIDEVNRLFVEVFEPRLRQSGIRDGAER